MRKMDRRLSIQTESEVDWKVRGLDHPWEKTRKKLQTETETVSTTKRSKQRCVLCFTDKLRVSNPFDLQDRGKNEQEKTESTPRTASETTVMTRVVDADAWECMYFMHFFLLSNLCPRRPTLQLSWLSLPHTHTGNNINNLSSRIFDRNSGYSEEQSSLSIKKMFIEKDKHRQKNWIEFSLQKSSLSTQVTLQLPWMPSWTLHRVQSETFINNNNKTNAIKKQDFRRKRKELSHEGVKNDSIQKRGSSLMIQTDKKTQKEIKSKLHPSSYLD